jgi:hypothetical protein
VIQVPRAGRAFLIESREESWAQTARTLAQCLSSPHSAGRRRIARRTHLEDLRPEDFLFVDIETTGLSSTPLFLIGTLTLEEGRLVVRQYLARDYAEEHAVLELFMARHRRSRVLVSFNGKSFDLPYIRTRLAYHRSAPPPLSAHFDVLLEARRIWRGSVPNCRLTTLEAEICGRPRSGDIEGALIPDAYHRYVRTGDAREMGLIVRHNRLDLLTMVDLILSMPVEDRRSWT